MLRSVIANAPLSVPATVIWPLRVTLLTLPFSTPSMVRALPVIGHVFGVGAGRDLDRVAIGGCVDRGLDGGVAAVADEQDVVGAGAVDLLDAGERVGALAAAGRHHEVAGAVVGDAGGADRGGIGRGVDAAAADDRVVAAEAGQRVGTGIAGELVVALRSRKGQPGGAGWVRFQSDVDDVVVINIAGMRDGRVEGAAELVKHVEPGVEAGDRIAGDGAAVGIDKGDAAVAVGLRGGPAGQGVVGDGYGAGIAG